jgi:hypothetical protein
MLNETAGSTAADLVGGVVATMTGPASWVAATRPTGYPRAFFAAPPGAALLVPIAATAACEAASLDTTVMLWVQPSGGAHADDWKNFYHDQSVIIGLCPPGGNTVCNGNELGFHFSSATHGGCFKNFRPANVGVWQHIAVVLRGGASDADIFVNGVLRLGGLVPMGLFWDLQPTYPKPSAL